MFYVGAITDFGDETYPSDTDDEEAVNGETVEPEDEEADGDMVEPEDKEADRETVEAQSATASSTSARVLAAPLASVLMKPQSSASASSDSEYVPSDDEPDVQYDVKHIRQRRICLKRKWTDDELDSLKKAFKAHILSGTQPGYAECQMAKNKFACLYNRTLPQIKARFIYLQGKL